MTPLYWLFGIIGALALVVVLGWLFIQWTIAAEKGEEW